MNELNSWLPIQSDSDFSIYNLPYGIFSVSGGSYRAGIAIGDRIVDLAACSERKWIDVDAKYFKNQFLNDYIGLGKKVTNKVRTDIQNLLVSEDSPLKEFPEILVKQSDAQMHMPVRVGDYTDFYSSIEHATNVGTMFRDPDKALLPKGRAVLSSLHGRYQKNCEGGAHV